MFSLVLSLAISAVNLTFLSTWTTVSSRSSGIVSGATTSQPLDYPNVYIGLEDVAHDPSRCLHRGTFPDTFYTYDARSGPSATLEQVQAPDDDVTLMFGGPVGIQSACYEIGGLTSRVHTPQIRAVIEARALDYGLENCTFVVHSSNTTHSAQGRSVDVYMLPATAEKPGEGQDGVFLETLSFIPGQDMMSRPFHCPSRARFRFELRCGEADCVVHVPLRGLTSKCKASSDTRLRSDTRTWLTRICSILDRL